MWTRVWEAVRPALQLVAMLAVVAIAGVIVLHEVNARKAAEDQAAKAAESARLERAGLVVAHDATTAQLQAKIDDATRRNSDLAEALARAQAAAPDLHPTGTVTASTGVVPVEHHSAAPPATSPATPPTPTASGSPPGAACVLTAADQGEVRVDEVVLDTKAGSRVLVGAASAWRAGPNPVRLFGGSFSAPLTTADVTPPPVVQRSRWGAGAYIGVAKGNGWSYGPALAFPQLSLWSLELDTTVGVGLGTTIQAGATAIVRW